MEELINAISNKKFVDELGRIFEFKIFPNSTNLIINKQMIGPFHITHIDDEIALSFDGSKYILVELNPEKIIFNQNGVVFELIEY